jgi:hypothetical protein
MNIDASDKTVKYGQYSSISNSSEDGTASVLLQLQTGQKRTHSGTVKRLGVGKAVVVGG